MYIQRLRAFLPKPPHIGDILPWDHVEDAWKGILATRDDGLLCTYRMDPFDLASMPKAEQGAVMLRINEAFRGLDEGWAVWLDAVRMPALDYHESTFSHPMAALMDHERRAALTAPGARWQTIPYITLWHRPTTMVESVLQQAVFTHDHAVLPVDDEQLRLEMFEADVSRIIDLLAGACHRLTRLDSDGLLTYLHSLVSIYRYAVETPDVPFDVSYLVADSDFWPGTRPQLGPLYESEWLRCLCLTHELPARTRAAMFRQLNMLPFDYRWVTRWIPMGRDAARSLTSKRQINWLSTQKNWRASMYELYSGESTDVLDSHMGKQARDADLARDETLSDESSLGYLTTTFVVRHADPREADRRIRELRTVLQTHGCASKSDPLNEVEAWLGTMPGQPQTNVRKLQLNTLNFAHLGLWHLPWAGVIRNEHLQAPPLCQALTEGCMPFGLDTFVGDLGHAVTIGPSGAGKSTLSAYIDYVQWLKYPEAQVIGFDVGGSWRCVTLALHGAYVDLGRGGLLQLLHGLDDPTEFPVIYEELLDRLREAEMVVTPPVAHRVSVALEEILRTGRPHTMTSLVEVLLSIRRRIEPLARVKQDPEMRQALEIVTHMIQVFSTFAQGGIYGHLTDAPQDRLLIDRVQTFELASLLDIPGAWPAVLSRVFHRAQRKLTGVPTRIPVGEAWVVFAVPMMQARLRQWIPSWRRQNGSGNFSTQSISQVVGNPLTSLLLESCQTRLFLPNPQALDAEVRPAYEGMELHEDEIRGLVMARPKRDAYIVRPDGKRMVNMGLYPIERAVCGANSKEAHHLMDALLDKHGAEEFPWRWLDAHGFTDEAVDVRHAHTRGGSLNGVMPLLTAIAR